MKGIHTAIALVTTAALGMSTMALADNDSQESLDRNTLNQMIDKAVANGTTSFEEFSVDDDDRVREVEFSGWADNDWELELTLDAKSGDMIGESRSRTVVSPWGLSQQQLGAILDRAGSDGIERFHELEMDSNGTIEVSGYGNNNREMELNYSIDDIKNAR